jgi:hypothetical protein
MDANETTPMKSIFQRGIGGITIPTTRLSRFLISRRGVMIMTRNNLHWILITSPDEDGNAQLSIKAHNGGQVAIRISGSTAAEIADLLIWEMHGEDTPEQPETIH